MADSVPNTTATPKPIVLALIPVGSSRQLVLKRTTPSTNGTSATYVQSALFLSGVLGEVSSSDTMINYFGLPTERLATQRKSSPISMHQYHRKSVLPTGKQTKLTITTGARMTGKQTKHEPASLAIGKLTGKKLEAEEDQPLNAATKKPSARGFIWVRTFHLVTLQFWAVPAHTGNRLKYSNLKRSPFGEKPKLHCLAQRHVKLNAPSGSLLSFKSQLCFIWTQAQAWTLFRNHFHHHRGEVAFNALSFRFRGQQKWDC